MLEHLSRKISAQSYSDEVLVKFTSVKKNLYVDYRYYEKNIKHGGMRACV
jgi:hypothetical protein